MRKLLLVLPLIMLMACNNGKSKNQKILPESSGKINNISVVVDNDQWDGPVGEAIRNTLATYVHGLPQDEPMFSMNQIPPSVFSGFATQNRTVFKVEKNQTPEIKILNDVFARPQKVVLVSGNSGDEIVKLITDNSEKILNAFKEEEIKEKQRRIKLSLHKNNTIKENLGLTINFPSAYRIAKESDKFYWIRKDISTGTTDLMLYELPFDYIKENDSLVNQVIKMRDSIGEVHIPGPLDGSFMVTDNSYSPFLLKTTINNKPAIETKGIWDVKGAFMSGPFVNYIIKDEKNNRLLVVEGFAFAPSVQKRDYMFELEAIIKSIKMD
ncbi:DUF4837 family protein [Corallibacter vietnamensis]